MKIPNTIKNRIKEWSGCACLVAGVTLIAQGVDNIIWKLALGAVLLGVFYALVWRK